MEGELILVLEGVPGVVLHVLVLVIHKRLLEYYLAVKGNILRLEFI